MFTPSDLLQLKAKGITPEQAQEQLRRFQTGFPPLKVAASATVDHGIARLDEPGQQQALDRWEQFLAQGGDTCKFVPASGAASRMFKSLFAFVDGSDDSPLPGSDVAQVIDRITDFAFYPALNEVCQKTYGLTVEQLKDAKRYKDIIAGIILGSGLNYGQLPKGLLQFHAAPEGPHTPVAEHIDEGAATAVKAGGTLKLHFTVSPDHRALFEKTLDSLIPKAETKYGIKIKVKLSEQKPFTDTIAANPDGTPFRTAKGELLFRPGGHGALIENLSETDAAVVFIKNIDNVVPEAQRQDTIKWKRILGGYLLQVHDQMERYITLLQSGASTAEQQREVVTFLRDTLQISDLRFDQLTGADLDRFLLAKLNRPLRVCGMVVNEGEPGGGPYIAVNPDGSSSPQILESHQITAPYKELMATATHFNPVDLVCYIHTPDGRPYDLRQFVDQATGFISQKSSQGRELQALELPGLWNGAMSDWNTLFVEVPATTFNPVKTVNDLLRPSHQ